DIGKLKEADEKYFIQLQLAAQNDPLRAIFVDQVLDSKFWNQCTDIVKLTGPLFRVLRIVDSEDRASTGFLYQAIYKVREEMLNPAFRFNAGEFEKHKQTTSGLLNVIKRYAYGDADLNYKLTSEIRIFKNAKQDFGRQSAIR
ncbi:hypothetical protein S83_051938, partial [Arachis hypogaea]